MFLIIPFTIHPSKPKLLLPSPRGPRQNFPPAPFFLSFFFLRELTRVFSSYRTVGNDLAGLGGRGPCGGVRARRPPVDVVVHDAA